MSVTFFFKDVLKEKIRLKNDSMKAQKKKMQMQLKQVFTKLLHYVMFRKVPLAMSDQVVEL